MTNDALVVVDNYTPSQAADVIGVSNKVMDGWIKNSKILTKDGLISREDVRLLTGDKFSPLPAVDLKRTYTFVDLFSGCGGLTLGLQASGLKHILSVDNDEDCVSTLKRNKLASVCVDLTKTSPDSIDALRGHRPDILAGGIPCQAFSTAGKQLGLEDARGTLFYDFLTYARFFQPKMLVIENVRGLVSHGKGETLNLMRRTIESVGYTIVFCDVLKAVHYGVPQKRERLILVAIHNPDGKELPPFIMRGASPALYTLRHALAGLDVSEVDATYSEAKAEVMRHVPEGGYWRDLPSDMQRKYMGRSFYSGGGKTGVCRRLHRDLPSLTLLTTPSQKQTERGHPTENRPLNLKEYARIQTFPDNFKFVGSQSSVYKQIGNAVPVGLAEAVGLNCRAYLDKLTNP